MYNEEVIQRLLSAARTAQRRAYAPYSNFQVGAALLTESGRVVAGCNFENASYGLTICAERCAIGQAVATAAGRPMLCVVVGPTPQPLTPCGACRQVLMEFNPDMLVICFGRNGDRIEKTMRELLPDSFGVEALDSAGR